MRAANPYPNGYMEIITFWIIFHKETKKKEKSWSYGHYQGFFFPSISILSAQLDQYKIAIPTIRGENVITTTRIFLGSKDLTSSFKKCR